MACLAISTVLVKETQMWTWCLWVGNWGRQDYSIAGDCWWQITISCQHHNQAAITSFNCFHNYSTAYLQRWAAGLTLAMSWNLCFELLSYNGVCCKLSKLRFESGCDTSQMVLEFLSASPTTTNDQVECHCSHLFCWVLQCCRLCPQHCEKWLVTLVPVQCQAVVLEK